MKKAEEIIPSPKVPSHKVKNVRTKKICRFSTAISPEDAVISAYAYLTVKDLDYSGRVEKYKDKVEKYEETVKCGDWVYLPPKAIDEEEETE